MPGSARESGRDPAGAGGAALRSAYFTLREAGLGPDTARDVEAAESLLRTIIDSSPDGFWIVDPEGRFVDVNPAYCEMIGYERSELLLMRIADVEALESPERVAEHTRELRARGGGRFESVHRRKDGRLVHVEVGVTFLGTTREIIVCFLRDVTERKRSEALLAASERRYRGLVENLNAGVVVVGRDGRISFANARAGFLLGVEPASLAGMPSSDPRLDLVGEDGEPVPAARHPTALVASRAGPVVNLVVRLASGRPGAPVWLLVNAYPDLGPGGEHLRTVVTFVDISRRKEAEAALAQSQAKLAVASRLAAMGTLVSGVAHEINNPLAATVSGQDSAQDDLRRAAAALDALGGPDAASVRQALRRAEEALDDAREGARRVSRIVKDLVSFGQPDPRRTRASVATVARQALRWVSLPATRARAIEVAVTDQGAPDVTIPAGQLEQVLMNLVTNAVKAIPDGRPGRVEVVVGTGPGGEARIEVVDDGAGIPAEILPRIFDPFFTTRPVGEERGTGLGLAICHAIVTAHGGTLTVQSTPGAGSTFRVELPAAAAVA